MAALRSRFEHYIFVPFPSSFFFFPRLMSAVGSQTAVYHDHVMVVPGTAAIRRRRRRRNMLYINILAGGSSVPLISERKGTDPHWKQLRCTHFGS